MSREGRKKCETPSPLPLPPKSNSFFFLFLKSAYALHRSHEAVSVEQIECHLRSHFTVDGDVTSQVKSAILEGLRNGYLAERTGR